VNPLTLTALKNPLTCLITLESRNEQTLKATCAADAGAAVNDNWWSTTTSRVVIT